MSLYRYIHDEDETLYAEELSMEFALDKIEYEHEQECKQREDEKLRKVQHND